MSDWGGARTPANPAIVSGPGALSSRTDGGVMDPNAAQYGEGVTLDNLKKGAPLARGGSPVSGASAQANPLASIVGLGAPSQQPNTPVTAGANAGAGPDASALGLPQSPGDEQRADAQTLGPALQTLIAAAGNEDATPSFKRLVRQVLYA